MTEGWAGSWLAPGPGTDLEATVSGLGGYWPTARAGLDTLMGCRDSVGGSDAAAVGAERGACTACSML